MRFHINRCIMTFEDLRMKSSEIGHRKPLKRTFLRLVFRFILALLTSFSSCLETAEEIAKLSNRHYFVKKLYCSTMLMQSTCYKSSAKPFFPKHNYVIPSISFELQPSNLSIPMLYQLSYDVQNKVLLSLCHTWRNDKG